MALVKELFEGRLFSLLLLVLSGAYGIEISEDFKTKLVYLIGTGLPALGLLWSRLQALEGREIYRRVASGALAFAVPAVYSLIGALTPEASDAERAAQSQALVGLVVLVVNGISFKRKRAADAPAPPA